MSTTGADWQAERAAMKSNAADLLEDDSAFLAIVPEIVVAIGQLCSDDPEAEGPQLLQMLGHAIAARLCMSPDTEWPDVFRERLASPGTPSTTRLLAVEMAIGKAAGTVFGNSPGDVEFNLVDNLLRALPEAYWPFDTAALAALREFPGRIEVLEQTLRNRAERLMMALQNGESTFSFLFGSLDRYSRIIPRIMDTWKGGHRYQPIILRDAFVYDLLRRVNAKRYITAVESLSDPSLIQSIIDTAGQRADTTSLCQLLRYAAPAFDKEGVWIETNIIPLLLLSHCTDKLSDLTAEVPNDIECNDRARIEESRVELMPNILDVLAERSDGVHLGYAWLQHLIWSGRSNGSWRDRSKNMPSPEFLAVLRQLGSWLPLRSNPEEWVAEEEDFWRNDRIYSILQISLCHPQEPNFAEEFVRAVLINDLVQSYGIEQFASDGGSHERYIVGSAIGSIPDPANWFQKLWSDLFRQRDRARRHRHLRSDGQDYPNVGKVAVMWGLCGLGFIDTNSQSSRELWLQLEAAARESILLDEVRLYNDAWRAVLCWLGAYWPVIFSDDPPSGDSGSLDDFISFWIAPSSEFAMLIAELHQHGVTTAQLKRSIRDSDVLRQGTRAVNTVPGNNPGAQFRSTIEKVADDLDR